MAPAVTGNAPGTVAPPTTGRTRRLPRALATAAWATALVAWSSTLGIPNDTVQVFVWLWLGTIAWDVEAPARHPPLGACGGRRSNARDYGGSLAGGPLPPRSARRRRRETWRRIGWARRGGAA